MSLMYFLWKAILSRLNKNEVATDQSLTTSNILNDDQR